MTLKVIARRLGLSSATVSYALKGAKKISVDTRARVRAMADEIGYCPNPRVSSLMAHIRRSRARPPGDRIAFVWVHLSPKATCGSAFLQEVVRGVRVRAEQSGFGLEEFWTETEAMCDRRLQEIILSRGIAGVVLSPVMTDETWVSLEWDWGRVAAAAVGNVTWQPALHRAGHHHYMGMLLALEKLEQMGCRRPAVWLEHDSNCRSKRAWEAAWRTCHPRRKEADQLLLVAGGDENDAINRRAWLEKLRPDGLLVSSGDLLESRGVRRTCARLGIAMATLHWDGRAGGPPGIDQCHGHIAANAVDLVVAQLHNNEIGLPAFPRTILFTGRWLDGAE